MPKFWIRFSLPFLEIIGGVCGIAIVIWQFVAATTDAKMLLFPWMAAAVYLFSLLGGVAMRAGAAFRSHRVHDHTVDSTAKIHVTAPDLHVQLRFRCVRLRNLGRTMRNQSLVSNLSSWPLINSL